MSTDQLQALADRTLVRASRQSCRAVLTPLHCGAFDDDLGPQVFLKFKHVDYFSLPSFVSRSSTPFSQLISQIGPNWAKSGWHEEHSEVSTEVRIDWADSVLIKLNQWKKYKLALLLSGRHRSSQHPFYFRTWSRVSNIEMVLMLIPHCTVISLFLGGKRKVLSSA